MAIWTEFGRTFFAGFFSSVFFFLRLTRKYTRKSPPPPPLSPRKPVNKKSSNLLKNFRKIIRNVGSRNLTPKSATLICHPILKILNMGKNYKISKNKFNKYSGQVVSHTSGKNISTVWIVGQFDMGELGCGTSFSRHFRSLKFSDKYDAAPATWAHVNGFIGACK